MTRSAFANGVKAVQITTCVTSHLDAAMVHDALHDLPLDGIDILFIKSAAIVPLCLSYHLP